MVDDREDPAATAEGDELRALLEEQFAEGGLPRGAALPSVPAPALVETYTIAQPFTNDLLVQYILAHPGQSHAAYAAAFGRTQSWFASVLATDSFQRTLDPYREQIADPAITASLEERFRGLTMRSLQVLQEKLDGKEVSDFIVVKAAEIGVKALGMGAVPTVAVVQQQAVGAEAVAEKLMRAMAEAKARANASATDATVVKETSNGG